MFYELSIGLNFFEGCFPSGGPLSCYYNLLHKNEDKRGAQSENHVTRSIPSGQTERRAKEQACCVHPQFLLPLPGMITPATSLLRKRWVGSICVVITRLRLRSRHTRNTNGRLSTMKRSATKQRYEKGVGVVGWPRGGWDQKRAAAAAVSHSTENESLIWFW